MDKKVNPEHAGDVASAVIANVRHARSVSPETSAVQDTVVAYNGSMAWPRAGAAISSSGDEQVRAQRDVIGTENQHIEDDTGAVVLFQPRRIPELREDTTIFLDYYDKSIA
ncbi:unnamed protein product, partial [Clonostachys rosea]